MEEITLTSPELVQELYQMMKDFHDVMVLRGEEYWVDGGTALGCVRHEGLIPWDDDLDVCIRAKSGTADPIGYLRGDFDRLGYTLTLCKYFYNRSYHLNLKGRPLCSGPNMDIFIMEEVNGKLYYPKGSNYGCRDGADLHYRADLVHPITHRQFGTLEICLASDHYFPFIYGEDWFTNGYQTFHDDKTSKNLSRVILDDANRRPALPAKPLEARIRLIDNRSHRVGRFSIPVPLLVSILVAVGSAWFFRT